MKNLEELIDEAKGIISMHQPYNGTVWSLFSGGKDSLVATHIASQMTGFAGVVHIRTLTGPISVEHSESAEARAQELGWRVLSFEPTQTYSMMVKEWGFPGPPAHSWMYRHLKERQIAKAVRAIKRETKKFAFVTGKRRFESQRRMRTTKEANKVSGRWWINPLANWKTEHVLAYMDNYDLSANLSKSQECLCGAFAHPGERDEIMAQSEGHKAWILGLEKIVVASREQQVLEYELGMRDKKDVIDKSRCRRGHGIGSSSEQPTDDDGNTICSTCDGRLAADGSGNVGIDPDAEMIAIRQHKTT